MRQAIRISPNTFPAIFQRCRAAGIDPQQFFNPDGTVDAEFFFTPEAVARAAANRSTSSTEPLIDYACGFGSFLIDITI